MDGLGRATCPVSREGSGRAQRELPRYNGSFNGAGEREEFKNADVGERFCSPERIQAMRSW
jgi:hypothetical protein